MTAAGAGHAAAFPVIAHPDVVFVRTAVVKVVRVGHHAVPADLELADLARIRADQQSRQQGWVRNRLVAVVAGRRQGPQLEFEVAGADALERNPVDRGVWPERRGRVWLRPRRQGGKSKRSSDDRQGGAQAGRGPAQRTAHGAASDARKRTGRASGSPSRYTVAPSSRSRPVAYQ